MPEWQDVSALPTSWGLTVWDALPMLLSVELAVVIVVMFAGTRESRQRYWSLTSTYVVGGLVYAATFDRTLTMLLASAIVLQTVLNRYFPPVADSSPVPQSPSAALKNRFGDVAWSIATAAFVAAVVKSLLIPVAAAGDVAWYPIAVAGGLIPGLALGTAAIPALAVQSASGSPIPAAVWLAATLARPYLSRQLPRVR